MLKRYINLTITQKKNIYLPMNKIILQNGNKQN